MTDTKPWYASQTVWGSLGAIATGIGGAVYAFQTKDMVAAMLSLGAAAGGFHALVGRFKADTPIGKRLHQVDDALTAATHLAPVREPTP